MTRMGDSHDRPVEQATAAPGEKRAVGHGSDDALLASVMRKFLNEGGYWAVGEDNAAIDMTVDGLTADEVAALRRASK